MHLLLLDLGKIRHWEDRCTSPRAKKVNRPGAPDKDRHRFVTPGMVLLVNILSRIPSPESKVPGFHSLISPQLTRRKAHLSSSTDRQRDDRIEWEFTVLTPVNIGLPPPESKVSCLPPQDLTVSPLDHSDCWDSRYDRTKCRFIPSIMLHTRRVWTWFGETSE